MSTAHSIDVNLQVNAMATGVSPIDGGRISFPMYGPGNLVQPARTFCRRITFSDLFVSGSDRHFSLTTTTGAALLMGPSGQPAARNLAGEAIVFGDGLSTDLGFLAIRTNVAAAISGVFASVPAAIKAGGTILMDNFIAGAGTGAPTQVQLGLTWSLAAINAGPGTTNFYCDLIFSTNL